MQPEHREAIREANLRRGNCGKCGATRLDVRDGAEIGGMPGLKYKVCSGCGWTRAITKRQKPEKWRGPSI
jgi:ribosomal protein S27AE